MGYERKKKNREDLKGEGEAKFDLGFKKLDRSG